MGDFDELDNLFLRVVFKIYKVGNLSSVGSSAKDLGCKNCLCFSCITMTFLGRASMMAFVFMATSYLVTGQIIPGFAWI